MRPSGASSKTEVIGDNEDIAPEVIGEPIAEYDVPSDQEGVDGTQDSTARTTFSKVSTRFLNYMLLAAKDSEGDGEDDFKHTSVDADSSDREWLPDYEDVIESSNEDFDIDIVPDCTEEDAGLAD
jgi:hypothetical protein